MTAFSKDVLVAAHRHSIFHKSEVSKSSVCGCFYCLHTFKPSEIMDWVDQENPQGPTAVCPKCGIDSVIGSESGYPIESSTFLKEMNDYYF